MGTIQYDDLLQTVIIKCDISKIINKETEENQERDVH